MEEESKDKIAEPVVSSEAEADDRRVKIQRMLGFLLFCQASEAPDKDLVHSEAANKWREDAENRLHWIKKAGELMTELKECGVSFSATMAELRKKLKTLATVPASLAYHED